MQAAVHVLYLQADRCGQEDVRRGVGCCFEAGQNAVGVDLQERLLSAPAYSLAKFRVQQLNDG